MPISKYGSDVTVELGARFHFVYLDEAGEALDSVSSNFVIDPGRDEIARAGFEETRALSLTDQVLQPGTMMRIGKYEFHDLDPNQDGVEVDYINVYNGSSQDDPLVFGQDITKLKLNLRLEEGGKVVERTISKEITTPASRVTFSTSPGGWWDGRCLDGCKLTLEVMGEVALSGPTQGMKLRTGVLLNTKENNGMSGYPFNQELTVPAASSQEVVVQGLEKIEETTDWQSGIVNRGEEYRQRLILSDNDLDSQDFTVNSVRLSNEGSLNNSSITGVSVYEVQPEGGLVELGSDLRLSSEWQRLDSDTGGLVPDDGRAVFELHYHVAQDAASGRTLKPVVQFRGREGVKGNARSPMHASPEAITVYPWGGEILEASRDAGISPPVSGQDKILAQRIDVMDGDENRLDLLINPIVVKNLGTATGSDFVKLELYDSSGELLAEKTDLLGLNTAGVTLGNLDGKTTVIDNQAGNWRTFYIYLTRKSFPGEKTVNLKTTLYQTEGEKDVVRKLTGPGKTLGRRRTAIDSILGRGEEAEGILPGGELARDFSIGLAAGMSYPNLLSPSAKLFLDYNLTGLTIFETESDQTAGFTRFGLDIDSVSNSGYYYPNATIGYKWAVDSGINQFGGLGAGAIFSGDPALSNNFALHGVYGVTTTQLLDPELPLLLQAKYKYLAGSFADSVLEVSFGVLFG